MGDRDVEGTSSQWGVKVTPPNTSLAPYFLAFASKEAAQHVVDTETVPCELVFRAVTIGPWCNDQTGPLRPATGSTTTP